MFDMKPILVHVDPRTAQLLDRYVPGRGRKRSKFIREAVLRALMDLEEVKTRRAYEKYPDDAADEWRFDPEQWAPPEEAIHPDSAAARALARAVKPRRARRARSQSTQPRRPRKGSR